MNEAEVTRIILICTTVSQLIFAASAIWLAVQFFKATGELLSGLAKTDAGMRETVALIEGEIRERRTRESNSNTQLC